VFLSDVLKVVDTDQVVFEMTEPNRPGLVRCGSDFLYVIMPLNLS
jgi:DNA polymerase III sliding clamp (beta) subunit (PCNA family)